MIMIIYVTVKNYRYKCYGTDVVWQPDKIGNKLNFDCFCLDIHLLILITYKLLLP